MLFRMHCAVCGLQARAMSVNAEFWLHPTNLWDANEVSGWQVDEHEHAQLGAHLLLVCGASNAVHWAMCWGTCLPMAL